MKVVTGKCRLSYVHVFEPQRQTDEHGKVVSEHYSVTLLIPKTDKETYKKLVAAQEDAITKKWPNKRPAKINTTLHDGDDVRPSDGEPFKDYCKGHWVLAVKSKTKPGVVDAALNPLMDKEQCMSGDYGRASINSYAYDVNGNKGVTFGLNNVQVICKGEPLGNRTRAEDDFDAIGEDELDDLLA